MALSIHGNVSSASKNSLNNLIDQLKTINTKLIWSNITSSECNLVIKIGLQMVYLFGEGKKEESLLKTKNELENLGRLAFEN